MKSERDILTKMDHPFVVSLWYAFQTDSKLFLVMDFLAGGELFFHLRRRGLILEKEAKFYFAEMILAIEFLHNMGVIHRDLKPENVLLRGDGHICLTDFGLAKEIGDGVNVRTLCGTSEYMAPEMLTRNGYGKGVDWWSLGALFFEMLCGDPPFVAKNPKDLDKKILTEKVSTPGFLTANAHSLLRGMLEKDV
jgi:ribosomal protein S6 kinase beta